MRAEEALENPQLRARGDTDPLIAHRDDDLAAGRADRDADVAAGRRVADRVVDDSGESLLEPAAVPPNDRQWRRGLDREVVSRRGQREAVGDVRH